jgi:hypothetical protein
LRQFKGFVFLFFIVYGVATAQQHISIGVGGGYSGNLFSDSFSVGNSYLLNNISISSTHFNKVKLRLQYDLYYYLYDTGDFINNLFHVPGFSLYQENKNRHLKWDIEVFAAWKDYTDPRATLDNGRLYFSGDISYYFLPGLQSRLLYQGIQSGYNHFSSLNYLEQQISDELVATLPTKTTLRAKLRYSTRVFNKGSRDLDWLDLETGLSQSLNMKTGLSFRISNRWTSGGIRPLESYNIISGITSYWDPWNGIAVTPAIRRILPWMIVSNLEASYWKRKFDYNQELRTKISWLKNKYGRTDKGWIARLELNRQFSTHFRIAQTLNFMISTGYTENNSNESFYEYHYFFITTGLQIRIF